MTALGQFFPKRTNDHVPNMRYAADVGSNGFGRIGLGPALVAADPDGILAAQPTDSAGSATSFAAAYSDDVMGRFGRNVTVDCSGANTDVVTITGRDYLGQLMVENITLNGTTLVNGVKCFARITEVSWLAEAAVTIDVGWGDRLGLPYKIVDLYSELVDGAEPANAGAVTVGPNTDPQTATTVDPRGYYAPHANNVPNGSRVHELVGMFDHDNLHGVAHYGG